MPVPNSKIKIITDKEKGLVDLPEQQEGSDVIDSEAFERAVNEIEMSSKWTLFIILVWSFIAGSKNLDFVWSYLSALQTIAHLSLLKN